MHEALIMHLGCHVVVCHLPYMTMLNVLHSLLPLMLASKAGVFEMMCADGK